MTTERPLLALHQGTGFISRAIRWQSRGPYSHASIILPSDVVIEAREFKGVQSLSRLELLPSENFVDIFEIDRDLPKQQAAIDWLWNQVGKKYDYSSVARFVSRRQARRKAAGVWFCSELAFAFFQECGTDVFRGTEPWEVSPALLSKSPLLKFKERLQRPAAQVYSGKK